MNYKKKFAMSIVILLAFSIMAPLYTAKAANENVTMYLDPATVGPVGLMIGSTFDVALKIDGVTDLWQWGATLSWDPAVITMTAPADAGPFLTAPNNFIQAPYTASSLPEVSCTKSTATGNSGSGILAIFHFQVVGIGSTTIDITNNVLKLPGTGHPLIPHVITAETLVTMAPPPATAPVAKFTPANNAIFYIEPGMTSVNVPLDASSSTDGFDTLPDPGASCPITSYDWTVTDPIGNVVVVTDAELSSFVADKVGIYTIKLQVVAPDTTAPTASSYVNNDDEIKTIEVRERPLGLAIDVYTNRGGEGAMVNLTDAYGPQEHVEVSALVTFNLAGVANKDVVFEIKDASNQTLGYRVARTNEQGIATIQYRLPWPTAPDDTFGMCAIIANVEVSEAVATDVAGFEFGYLVLITDVAAPSEAVRQTEVTITVNYRSIRSVDVPVFFTVVFYDAAMVPVSVDFFEQDALADISDSVELKFTTPAWAFIGFGVNYANAFNADPSLGGTPSGPEVSKDLRIVLL